jgi:hypothetical protein
MQHELDDPEDLEESLDDPEFDDKTKFFKIAKKEPREFFWRHRNCRTCRFCNPDRRRCQRHSPIAGKDGEPVFPARIDLDAQLSACGDWDPTPQYIALWLSEI